MWELRYERDGYSIRSGKKKRRGQPLPDWYLDKPELPEGSGFFLEAYRDLCTCRPLDGPIPWDKVALYADWSGLEPDVASLLWSVIRTMDLAERKWTSDSASGSESTEDA